MNYEYQYVTLTCDCGTKLEIKARILRGYSDHEMIECPSCNHAICEIRADMGYDIINVVKPET